VVLLSRGGFSGINCGRMPFTLDTSNAICFIDCVSGKADNWTHFLFFGSSSESVGTNPLKTEFESANDFIFERKHQGWKSLSV